MSSKKARLSRPEPELARAPTRFDHLEMVKTSLESTIDAPIVSIIHPTSVAHLSSSSAPVVGTFEASANHEIEEASEHADS